MKKLICISSDIFIRNYMLSGAFNVLEDDDTFFIVSNRVKNRHCFESKKNFMGYVEELSWRERAFEWLINIQMIRHFDRSRTFRFRFNRYPWSQRLKYMFAALPGLSSLVMMLLRRHIGENQSLRRYLKDVRPEVMILPSAAVGLLDYDVARESKDLKIRTLFLVDGWDNLSSKTVFLVKPDFLGVWGPQSQAHARVIHDMPQSRVFNIGTPRFDHYFRIAAPARLKAYPFPYVLFAGNAIPFDELSALQALDAALAGSGIPDVRIIYRPHPWRQQRCCPDLFQEEDFKRIVIDKTVREAYYMAANGQRREAFAVLPPLDEYPSLLANALCVVSPLSTMMIEAAIFNTPVLALAYDDGIHYTSPHNALREYVHFEGVENLPGFVLCHKKPCLERTFLEVLDACLKKGKPEGMRESLRQYLFFEERVYAQRLADAVHVVGSGAVAI